MKKLVLIGSKWHEVTICVSKWATTLMRNRQLENSTTGSTNQRCKTIACEVLVAWYKTVYGESSLSSPRYACGTCLINSVHVGPAVVVQVPVLVLLACRSVPGTTGGTPYLYLYQVQKGEMKKVSAIEKMVWDTDNRYPVSSSKWLVVVGCVWWSWLYWLPGTSTCTCAGGAGTSTRYLVLPLPQRNGLGGDTASLTVKDHKEVGSWNLMKLDSLLITVNGMIFTSGFLVLGICHLLQPFQASTTNDNHKMRWKEFPIKSPQTSRGQ